MFHFYFLLLQRNVLCKYSVVISLNADTLLSERQQDGVVWERKSAGNRQAAQLLLFIVECKTILYAKKKKEKLFFSRIRQIVSNKENCT